MFLVSGAGGTVGRHVAALLREGGHPVRAMFRRPPSDALAGVETIRADFDDPPSLDEAVAGVSAVFLLTAPAVPTADHDLALLAAARQAGVTAVVKLSAIGTGERFGDTVVGSWHETAEHAVRASGMAWTVLRPSAFASNCLRWTHDIHAGRPVPSLTGAGKQGVIDPRDVAAVAVAALTSTPLDPTAAPAGTTPAACREPGPHAGKVYTLTGPDLLDATEQAAQLEEIIGRPVTVTDLPPEIARTQLISSGMPPAAVDAVVTGAAWARAGHNATLTDDVVTVLGRPPATFRDWAQRHRAAFTAARSRQAG